jgi:hypothetical protein
MEGDDRVRFCSQCNLNVYNLSAMGLDEAEALVAGAEGRLCVRFYRRTDGTIITQDCPVGVQAVRQRTFRRIRNTVAGATAMIAGAVGPGGSRQSWAAGAGPGGMAAVRSLPSQVDAAVPLHAGNEQGEVATLTMGDTLKRAIMGKVTPPDHQDSVQEEEHTVMGIMVAPDPEPEDTTGSQPTLTPGPEATMGQAFVPPVDSTRSQNDTLPTVVPHPRIR